MKDNAISLKEFWDLVKRLNGDVKRCMEALDDAPEDDEKERAFWRRMYARSVFALIDGATYRMMFHAYAARERPEVAFSLDELTRLEKYYDFDEEQEAVTTLSKTEMLESIKFAFNAFARVHYSDFIFPAHGPSWLAMKEIARIRECLQYPRNAQEVEVYEENIDNLVDGLLWFVEQMADLLESCRRHTEEKFAAWESDEDEIVM